jgi:hypothetical protein
MATSTDSDSDSRTTRVNGFDPIFIQYIITNPTTRLKSLLQNRLVSVCAFVRTDKWFVEHR